MTEKIEWIPCDREVLTTTSAFCRNGEHDRCRGLLKIADVVEDPPPEQIGRRVMCICACHLVPGTGN
jgi:hypothetical protein